MAKIWLTEQQFKDYCRIMLNEERKADFTKKILNEALAEMDVYQNQNQLEIANFLRGLENGSAMVDTESAAVPYPEEDEYANDEPSRWIVYDFSDPGHLRDDGYSMQHIPIPADTQLKIKNLIYNNFGITVPDEFDQ